MLISEFRMKAKPCNLKGFYKPVYYEIVSQECRHRSELKKKASTLKVLETKLPTRTVNKRRKEK